jgi:hypothetical protein
MKVKNGVELIILALCLLIFPGDLFAETVKINWNDNLEKDLYGYKVFCGTTLGIYDNVFDVGYKKPIYVSGLQDGFIYYFAVSAYDCWGNESALSSEVKQTISTGNTLDDLIDLSLYPTEILYQLGVYDPASAFSLENSISGIRIDMPSGATDSRASLAIGSSGPDPAASYLEFDIAPDGMVLRKPAMISVPFYKCVDVERYDEEANSWIKVDNVTVGSNTVSFSVQVLGRYLISGQPYVNASSSQLDAGASSSQLDAKTSSADSSGGGGGGGGCFMGTSSRDESLPFLLWISIMMAISVMTYRSTKFFR